MLTILKKIFVGIFIHRSGSIQVNLWKLYTLNLPEFKCLLLGALFLA